MSGQDGARWLHAFAAKGLQSFVLGSDELRDMVGATELVDRLARDKLVMVLEALGIRSSATILSQAAGGARIRFENEADARKLAAVWPMVCAQLAPGLEVTQAVVPIAGGGYLKAILQAEEALAVDRNRPRVSLPEIAPIVARNSRTGLACVDTEPDRDDDRVSLPVDIEAQAKRPYRGARGIFEAFGLASDKGWEGWRKPDDFEEISGDEREYLGVIHADGNRLGQMFIDLATKLKDATEVEPFYRELSSAIDGAGRDAACRAVEEVKGRFLENRDGVDCPRGPKEWPWPLLPVVLAGDDLTVVIRADLAVDFAASYLRAFADITGEKFKALRARHSTLPLDGALPASLTAGAGIAFVKRRFPFSSAYALCESIAAFAKRSAKDGGSQGPPCALAFHRVTASSTSEDFNALREGELRGAAADVNGKAKPLSLSMAPYVVGEGTGSPSLDALKKLADLTMGLPRGQVRELLGLLETDAGRAQKHFERIVKIQTRGKEFAAALGEMTGGGLWDSAGRTPLADALTLAYFKERGARYDAKQPGRRQR